MIKEITIVGLPYYDYPRLSLRTGDVLELVWDMTNKHSKTAVVVFYEGYKIGYVSGRESEGVLDYIKSTSTKVGFASLADIRSSCIKAKLIAANKLMPKFPMEMVKDDAVDAARYLPGEVPLYTRYRTEYEAKFNMSQSNEEKTMFDKIVSTNAAMANSAAFLEAGRIANNTAAKFVASKSPLMVRGYVDTAFGKLLIANAAAVAAEKFRPADKKLARLANAMITEAYQEVYQLVDIEKMLNEMLSSESVKAALAKLEVSDASATGG